jgi:hypothetical protein
MNTTKFYCRPYFLKGLLALVLLSLISGQSFAANYSLEIIQPRPSLDTKNRFYKAYPDLEYNVRLSVIGGDFPYRFELTSAPSGMTIDGRGEITWPKPTASGSPYSVSTIVTDAQAITTSVSWTITVTTSGFRFIDAVNGTAAESGGTGAIENPWKSLKDMYEGDNYASKGANSYAGEFVYWREGRYIMDAYKEGSGGPAGGLRIPLGGNLKPQVWLAYPGEMPVLDLSAAHLLISTGGTDAYFDGLEFDINGNQRKMGVQIDSSASRITFRKNKFHGITNAVTGGNSSLIFISRADVGDYYTIQDNEFYDVGTNGYGVLGYWARNVLIENNTLHHINQHPISPKAGTDRWFIRSNLMYNNPTNSINVQYAGAIGVDSGNMEISYNLVGFGGGLVKVNGNQAAVGNPMYMFRNTLLAGVLQNKVTTTNGPFHWYGNVILNETSDPEKIGRNLIDDPTRLIITNNLTGSAAENIVDTNGFLTESYSNSVGIRGHVRQRPRPPTSVILTN